MTAAWQPWRRLLPVWLPAVVICLLAAAAYAWQTSETGGRAALVRNSVEELEDEIVRLEQIRDQTEQGEIGRRRTQRTIRIPLW